MGTLYVVATPIGNLSDISPRAVETLARVAVIACEDTRTSKTLLARHGITARTVSLHQHNEEASGGQLIERLRAGDDIALISDRRHRERSPIVRIDQRRRHSGRLRPWCALCCACPERADSGHHGAGCECGDRGLVDLRVYG